MTRTHLLAMCLWLAACATDAGQVTGTLPTSAQGHHGSLQVHLDTGEDAPRTFTPPRRVPVEITRAQFETAMARLVAGLDLPSYPRQRLALLSCWCEHRGTPGDCLSLLGEESYLGPEARRTLALTISLNSVWEGAVGTWAAMVDPVALQSLLMSAMAGYLAALAFPNPVTQAAAVSFGCFMVAYLGLETVWSLLEGWRQLELETQRARTFVEVREAGERFGRVMGGQVGRLLVMLATVAIGSTTNLMMKGPPPGLPGYAHAAMTARTQMGLDLGAVGLVRQILVGQASLTLTLAPGALAMSTQGTNNGGGKSPPTSAPQASTPNKYRLTDKDIEPWRKPKLTEEKIF